MALHERYEELCALATNGDLREENWIELRDHLQKCEHCRTAYSSFKELYILLAEAAEAQSTFPVPDGMTERFLARARAAGVRLMPMSNSARDSRPPFGWHIHIFLSQHLWAALALLIVVACSVLMGIRLVSKHSSSTQVSAPAPEERTSAAQETAQSIDDNNRLREELRRMKEQMRTTSSSLEDKERALEAAKSEIASLMSQILELKAVSSSLQDDQARRNAQVKQLQSDLEQAKAKENDARTAFLEDQEQLGKLHRDLKAAQDLNTALREAHDLIVDRNVHVLNVLPEIDDSTESRQPRGRIFYAEGKKLVFYAYDLNDPEKINAKASFYLWGEAPTVQHLVSLGKFHIDSEQQGRWVLRVSDPRLLAHISSVFVTLEPDKSIVTKPTGKKMLSGLLRSKTYDH
jgi:hypothetical protein